MNKEFLTSMGFPLSVASPSIGCFILERNIARMFLRNRGALQAKTRQEQRVNLSTGVQSYSA